MWVIFLLQVNEKKLEEEECVYQAYYLGTQLNQRRIILEGWHRMQDDFWNTRNLNRLEV